MHLLWGPQGHWAPVGGRKGEEVTMELDLNPLFQQRPV